MSVIIIIMANSICNVMSHSLRPLLTTCPPSQPCTSTKINAAPELYITAGSVLRYRKESAKVAVIRSPITAPISRLMYSVHVLNTLNCERSNCGGSSDGDVGGIHKPKHLGQSGQPSPAPEARTNPPIKMRKMVAPTVVRATFW